VRRLCGLGGETRSLAARSTPAPARSESWKARSAARSAPFARSSAGSRRCELPSRCCQLTPRLRKLTPRRRKLTPRVRKRSLRLRGRHAAGVSRLAAIVNSFPVFGRRVRHLVRRLHYRVSRRLDPAGDFISIHGTSRPREGARAGLHRIAPTLHTLETHGMPPGQPARHASADGRRPQGESGARAFS
jgi:hypothetical protein